MSFCKWHILDAQKQEIAALDIEGNPEWVFSQNMCCKIGIIRGKAYLVAMLWHFIKEGTAWVHEPRIWEESNINYPNLRLYLHQSTYIDNDYGQVRFEVMAHEEFVASRIPQKKSGPKT